MNFMYKYFLVQMFWATAAATVTKTTTTKTWKDYVPAAICCSSLWNGPKTSIHTAWYYEISIRKFQSSTYIVFIAVHNIQYSFLLKRHCAQHSPVNQLDNNGGNLLIYPIYFEVYRNVKFSNPIYSLMCACVCVYIKANDLGEWASERIKARSYVCMYGAISRGKQWAYLLNHKVCHCLALQQ